MSAPYVPTTVLPRDERIVRALVDQVLDVYVPLDADIKYISRAYRDLLRQQVIDAAAVDALEFARRDPACHGSVLIAGHGASGFRAVIGYRIAHHLHTVPTEVERGEPTHPAAEVRLAVARRVHERVKVDFLVDIHPGAEIGPGLILDHARGVIVGETAIIGRSCCLLQGVIIGAADVNTGRPTVGRRHPAIGDHVTVAGNAKIFGPISIGSGVRIDPDAVVTEDIPAGSRVQLISRIQVITPELPPYGSRGTPVRIFGIAPHRAGRDLLRVLGTGLRDVSAARLTNPFAAAQQIEVVIVQRADDELLLRAETDGAPPIALANLPGMWLELEIGSGRTRFLVHKHEGLLVFLDLLAAGRG
jgi:serine acetyltransferase